VATDYTKHDPCGLLDSSEMELPEHLRGPTAIANSDMFVLNSRLDDLDFDLVGGQALDIGGDAMVRSTRLLLQALRSEQHIDPWLRCNTAQAASIAELNALFTQWDCPARSARFFDQRFIDFLFANIHELPSIHWGMPSSLDQEPTTMALTSECGPRRQNRVDRRSSSCSASASKRRFRRLWSRRSGRICRVKAQLVGWLRQPVQFPQVPKPPSPHADMRSTRLIMRWSRTGSK
jgi:hypothetical protein